MNFQQLFSRLFPLLDRLRIAMWLLLSVCWLLQSKQVRNLLGITRIEALICVRRMLLLNARLGGKHASFRRMSMPVTSPSYVWLEATWDSKLTNYWQQGRRNLKAKLPMAERVWCFWVELWIRYGFLDLAWKACHSLDEAALSESLRRILYVHRMDIVCLVSGWKQELRPYYQHELWFDPDKVEGFEDGLSQLFASITEETPSVLFQECVSCFPDHAEVYEIYGWFKERRRCVKEALNLYRIAYAINSVEVIRLRIHHLMYLTGEQILGGRPAYQVGLLQCSTRERAGNIEYSYTMMIAGRQYERQVKIPYGRSKLLRLENVIPMHGGLAIQDGDCPRLFMGTKHLGLDHLKCFAPVIVTHDEKRFLMEKVDIAGLRKHCFILPGMGWNYYHWLLETVPLLRHYGEITDAGEGPPLAVFFPLKKWHLETLQLIGMGSVGILPFEDGQWFKYECAWVPEFASQRLVPSPDDIKFLRERLAKPARPKRGKKVFLSRRGVRSVRDMTNREAIEEKYRVLGFDVVDPSKMSLAQQIDFFSDVEEVAAEGGAALANMVFCPKETRFHIHSGDRAWGETFSVIAGSIGQELTVYLNGSCPIPNAYYLWTAFDVVEKGKK